VKRNGRFSLILIVALAIVWNVMGGRYFSR
jgi:hypothetical protein